MVEPGEGITQHPLTLVFSALCHRELAVYSRVFRIIIMIKKRRTRINPAMLERSRSMHREPVLCEKVMWEILKNRKLARYKFRRQYVIGCYIADFVCLRKKFILELDGDSHIGREAYDQRRTHYLNMLGFQVYRITNSQLLGSDERLENELVLELESLKSW